MRLSVVALILPLVAALPQASQADESASLAKRYSTVGGNIRFSENDIKTFLKNWSYSQIASVDPSWTREQVDAARGNGPPGTPTPLEDAKQQSPEAVSQRRRQGTWRPPISNVDNKFGQVDSGSGNAIEPTEVVNRINSIEPPSSEFHKNKAKAPSNLVQQEGSSDKYIEAVLAAHNVARNAYNPGSPLTWNREAANVAQKWAQGCLYEHPETASKFSQNIGVSGVAIGSDRYLHEQDPMAADEVIRSFIDEESKYDFNHPNFDSVYKDTEYYHQVGHFLNIVTDATGSVGCASSFCDSQNFKQFNKNKEKVPLLDQKFFAGGIFTVCNYKFENGPYPTSPESVPHKNLGVAK